MSQIFRRREPIRTNDENITVAKRLVVEMKDKPVVAIRGKFFCRHRWAWATDNRACWCEKCKRTILSRHPMRRK